MSTQQDTQKTPGKAPASLARSSTVMLMGTLVSRILGFVRNTLVVMALGATASGAADAFNTANALSTWMYNLLIGGILNAVLVPQIVRALRQRNGDELVNRLLTAAGCLLLGVTVVLTAAAPLVILLYAPGLDRWLPLAFAFGFWCMPQIFFYGLYALWGQVLNARSVFGPYMWSPVLNNALSIGFLVAYINIYGRYAAGEDPSAWTPARIALIGGTTTLGIVAQALVLYIPLRRSGFKPRIIFGVRGIGLGNASKVAMWALLGVFVVGLGDLATTNLGSRALTAAESAAYAGQIVPSTTMFNNAFLVYMLPQSLVVTSVITALFTRMSEKAAAGDREGVRDDLSLGLRSVAVFTVLASVGISVLATPALQAFVPSISLAEATASAPVLVALALGIVPQGFWFTTQRVMLAYADTRRLLRADATVGIVPVILAIIAYNFAPADHWMVWAAAGSSVATVAGSIVVTPLVRRHIPGIDGRRVLSTHLRLYAASLPAAVVGIGLRALMGQADGSMTGTRALDALVQIVVIATIMTVIYFAVARMARVEEIRVFFVPLSRLLARAGRSLPGPVGRAASALATALSSSVPSSPAAAPESDSRTPVSQEADGAAPAQSASPVTTGSAPQAPSRPDAPSPEHRPESSPADMDTAPSATLASQQVEAVDPARAVQPATMGIHRTGQEQTGGAGRMNEAKPIGSGRYEVVSTLSATLPRVIRHLGRDTILDREVTILTLTDATPHREDVLEAASRAILVEDTRVQRVYDVERDETPFIVTQPASGRPLVELVEAGLTPAQVRAIVGETAQALDAASLRGLHHLNLSADSIRVHKDGVQVLGVGIESAILGLEEKAGSDPLAPDRADARALVEVMYYALTHRWPGKRPGVPSAPTADGVPVRPSALISDWDQADQDLDALAARCWGSAPPLSAAEVAASLSVWDSSCLVGLVKEPRPIPEPDPGPQAPPTAPTTTASSPIMAAASSAGAAVLGGLRGAVTRLRARMAARRQAAPQPAKPPAVGAPPMEAPAPAAGPRPAPSAPVAPTAAGAPATASAPAEVAPAPAETAPEASPAPAPDAFQQQVAGAPPASPMLQQPDAHAPVDAAAPEPKAPLLNDALPLAEARTSVSEPQFFSLVDPAAEQSSDADDESEEDASVRLASFTTTVVILAGLVLVAVVGVIYAVANLFQLADLPFSDDDVPAAKTVPSASAPATSGQSGNQEPEAPAAIVISGVESLDPYGDNNEHPELSSAMIDGDPATEWHTRYYTSPSLSWKQGIGVAVTLEQAAAVSSIEMQGTGSGGAVQIRATSAQDPQGGTLLAEGAFTSGTTTFSFDATETQSIVIWVTELPTASDGQNKVTISEITLK
ncbi:lipid II flippase MurJ [Actinomyces oricola]